MAQATKNPVEGTFGATGNSNPFVTREGFNLSLSGFGTATVVLQRSFDQGSNWRDVESFDADAEKRVDDPESGVYYRLNCSAYTSGPIAYRLSS